MEEGEAPKENFMGMAIIGLYFIVTGILFIAAFVARITGNGLPSSLEFKSDQYCLLLMGIVNLISSLGLLYRSKTMWSSTIVFTIIMLAGSLLNLFFVGPVNIVLIVTSVIVLIYLFTRKAKIWYGVI